MKDKFVTPKFLDYLDQRLDLPAVYVNDLLKERTILEVAEYLIEKKVYDKETIGKAFGEYMGYTYVDINNVVFDPKYMTSLSIDYLKSNFVLPLFKFGNAVTVATSDPANPFLQGNIEKQLHSVVSLVFSFPSDIINFIEKNYNNNLEKV